MAHERDALACASFGSLGLGGMNMLLRCGHHMGACYNKDLRKGLDEIGVNASRFCRFSVPSSYT